MEKLWEIGTPDAAAAAAIGRGGVTKLCAEVLASRGVSSLEAAHAMLDAQALSDPMLLKDMDRAAERILRAVESGERICVYGDFDCDGVTSTVILYDWLCCAGADALWYIPTREEGYGLNCARIEKLRAQGVQLIVTVDNGISALAEAKYIAELGMELVITDHHRPGAELPQAYAVVDPFRRDCPSVFKPICGAVVALKLTAALDGGDCETALEQFGDLAALATIADVMPLEDENRYLVRRGLHLLCNTERIGLRALMAVGGFEEGAEITATDAAFHMIPHINSAGRMQTANLAVQLLLTEDPDEAEHLASQLNQLNELRKKTETEILSQIMEQIRRNPKLLCGRVLFFAGEGWHHGVIGVTAAKLTERYGKPCYLMTREPDGYRGSARGIDGYSIFESLQACAPLLTRFGGHPGAGGFSLAAEQVDAFAAALEQYAAAHHPVMPAVTVKAVRAVSLRELTHENISGLSVLEPFGTANPNPVFALLGASVVRVIPLSGGAHTKLLLQMDGAQAEALLFRKRPEETGFAPGMQLDFLVTARAGEFRGRKQVTLYVEDWRISEQAQKQAIAAQQTYDSYRRGEQLPSKAYYQRMCPRRADLVAVYQSVKGEAPVTLARISEMLRTQGMNRCRARICADVFDELKLMRYDAAADTLSRVPAAAKRDLTDSVCYREILKLAQP